MKLADIQALRPPEGADSDTIAAAIEIATTERQAAAARQAAAEAIRADPMAHEAKALKTAVADAEEARFDVERFDNLLPLLRDDYTAACGRETVAELRRQAEALEPLAERLRCWQRDTYPQIAGMIGEGLHAQHELVEATQALIARVEVEYHRPEVRDVGPLGITYPEVDEHLPEALFHNFELTP